VDDHVGAFEQSGCFQCQQVRIARTGANQVDFAGHGVVVWCFFHAADMRASRRLFKTEVFGVA
jgi:hypothetical protein